MLPANFIPDAAQWTKAFLPLVMLFLMLAPSIGLHAQATDLHGAATQLTKKLHEDPDVQKITGEHIVIAPFENINGKGDAVPRILQEMLTTSFIKAKHFKVLERDQLQSALDELHFQLSDLADPAKAKKIGKLAGATYVLLGSISDTGGTTTINARIVSIESGESVAAEDMDIKTADGTSSVGGLNPSSNPATTTATSDTPQTVTITKPETPAVDLNAKATSVSAGQYIGQKNDFGLLGGTKFQIAWRESLGQQPVYSFSAGDIFGDGTKRLVTCTQNSAGNACIRVLKLEDGRFKQTWESEGVSWRTLGGDYLRVSPDGSYLRVSQEPHQPAIVSLSHPYRQSNAWQWDGTNFSSQVAPKFETSVIEWLPNKPLTYLGKDNRAVGVSHLNDHTFQGFYNQQDWDGAITTADLDGDGMLEIAEVAPSATKTDGKPIEVYSLTGLRKAVTLEFYGNRLTTWNSTAFKHPFLVAIQDTADADGKPNGGYIYFIQWNGESYERVWKSNQIDDQIIDMQVCDPKGEGKSGLVILSADKKGYYLTKIVHVN